MATVDKTFVWDADLESWVLTNTSLNAFARDAANGYSGNGSIYGLESASGAGSTGYGVANWKPGSADPTWESFGVPAGATVTAVQVTSCRTYAGLTESDGFGSATWLCQIASAAASWAATTLCTRTRTSVDSSWYAGSGSEVAVPAGAQASNTVLQLSHRTTCVRSTGTGTGVSAHVDYLTFHITYTEGATPRTGDATGSAVLQAARTGDAEGSAALLAARTGDATGSAVLSSGETPRTGDATGSAALLGAKTGDAEGSSVLLQPRTGDAEGSAVLLAQRTGDGQGSAVLQAPRTGDATGAAVLRAARTGDATGSAQLSEPGVHTGDATGSAVLLAERTDDGQGSAALAAPRTGDASGSAVVQAERSADAQGAAVLQSQRTGDSEGSAVLRAERSGDAEGSAAIATASTGDAAGSAVLEGQEHTPNIDVTATLRPPRWRARLVAKAWRAETTEQSWRAKTRR